MKRQKYCMIAMMIAAVLSCTACEKNVSSTAAQGFEEVQIEEKHLITEGVDTPIRIIEYSRYAGKDKECFLMEGDKVAVISPSSLPDQAQVDTVVEGLKKWGYIPVEGKYVCTENRTLDNCREDLEWALEDPEIRGIFCVRGGFASCEVMEAMDRDLIAKADKPIIGYSDITACHSGWTTEGVPSIHASMSAAFSDLPEECREAERRLLQGEIPKYQCDGSVYDHQGTAEGILIGGNTTVLMTVANTPYDCTKLDQPYILFLEDVECDYHQIFYALTVLKNNGVLDNAAGIILGEWTDTDTESGDYIGDSRGGRFASAYEMIYRQFLKDLDKPIAYGFPAGHGEKNYPLLMGERARLTVSKNDFTLEWIDVEK